MDFVLLKHLSVLSFSPNVCILQDGCPRRVEWNLMQVYGWSGQGVDMSVPSDPCLLSSAGAGTAGKVRSQRQLSIIKIAPDVLGIITANWTEHLLCCRHH